MIEPLVAIEPFPIAVQIEPVWHMTEDDFFRFCQINRNLRIEKTAEGEIIIMPPTGGATGNRNAAITAVLYLWAIKNGTGIAFDSSTGFNLPNGATRAPDAAWVQRERLARLTAEQKQKFLPLAPDFAIELHSASDRLRDVKDKMQEYMTNGVRLGWLIDPQSRSVFIYRPESEPVHLQNPVTISGEPELPGFELNLTDIWEPGF